MALRRAANPAAQIIVTGALWNQLCDAVEAGRITVDAPLAIRRSPGGQVVTFSSGKTLPLLKITGNATCGGVYTARVWRAPASIDVTVSTFSGTILGTDPGADNAYLVNLPEITLSTHDLTNAANTRQNMYVGLRWSPATDGKPCYLCLGFWNEDCT